MALFRKKKSTTTEIPELQEYYASQRKENTFVAWLLAFGSLLLTIAVLVGLFAGGRWLYRTVFDNDEQAATTTTEQSTPPADSDKNAQGSTGTATPPSDSGSTSTSTGTDSGSSTPAPGVSPAQSDEANKNATAATTSIPNSGPSSMAIFLVPVFIGSYLLHRNVMARRLK